jgi:hypothetical protein
MHEKSRTCGTSWRHVSQLHRRNECSRATMRTVYNHVAVCNLPRPQICRFLAEQATGMGPSSVSERLDSQRRVHDHQGQAVYRDALRGIEVVGVLTHCTNNYRSCFRLDHPCSPSLAHV